MIVKIQFEGAVKRIYEETRGQYTSKYVVVTDGGEKYPNILRFKLKQNNTTALAEGARVKIAAYLDGREWTNQQGQTMYFTDLTVDTVEVLSGSEALPGSGAAEPRPTAASDWASLCAVATAHGESLDALKARCESYKARVNRKFTPEDWQILASAVVAAHTPTPPQAESEFSDDAPF